MEMEVSEATGVIGNEKNIDVMDECVCILRQETTLLERLALTQEQVRNAVFAREWTDLELMIARLDSYGKEFESMERERVKLFTQILAMGDPNRDHIGFYTLVSHFPQPRRRELTDLYRRLKLDTLKVRLANESLMKYLNDARATISGFLEAAFPDRKGRIYSRKGKQVHSEMRSIVLDRSF